MNKLVFKWQDFDTGYILTHEGMALFAQNKFDTWLKEQKTVTGYLNDSGKWIFEEEPYHGDTHKAMIVCIEPIINCKHENEKITVKYAANDYRCECGVKVKPVAFEEVK